MRVGPVFGVGPVLRLRLGLGLGVGDFPIPGNQLGLIRVGVLRLLKSSLDPSLPPTRASTSSEVPPIRQPRVTPTPTINIAFCGLERMDMRPRSVSRAIHELPGPG
jgi:hypothetical protein